MAFKLLFMLTLASVYICAFQLVQGDRMCATQQQQTRGSNNNGYKLVYNDNNELSKTRKKENQNMKQQGNECKQQQQQQEKERERENIKEYVLPFIVKVEAATTSDNDDNVINNDNDRYQRIKRSNILNPFDFANLRHMQQRKQQQHQQKQQTFSKNNNNNKNYNDYNQQHQLEQQWRRRLQPAMMIRSQIYTNNEDNSSSNDNDNNMHNNNNNNDYAYSQLDNNNNNDDYSYNLYNNNDNNNKQNNNNNILYGDGSSSTKLDYGYGYGFKNGNSKNGGWFQKLTEAAASSSSKAAKTKSAAIAALSPTQQDANNDFRLQLSDTNEPVSDNRSNNYNKNNNNRNSKRNSNNKGSISSTTNNNNDDIDSSNGIGNGIESHRNSRTDKRRVHNSATHADADSVDIDVDADDVDADDDAAKAADKHNKYSYENSAKSENGDTTTTNSTIIKNNDEHRIKTRAGQRPFNNYASDDFIELNDNNNKNNEEELSMELPYGIQNVRKRTVRENVELKARSISTTYQSLCPTKRVPIPLETSGYEYRPNQYIEVTCVHNYSPSHSYNHNNNKNKICSEAGFSCIQLNRTIHLIRRNKAMQTECWESEIRIVPSGCECMWPKSNGDIMTYHNNQKRFHHEANERPEADYVPGEGYLQLPRQIKVVSLDGHRRGEPRNGYGFEGYTVN